MHRLQLGIGTPNHAYYESISVLDGSLVVPGVFSASDAGYGSAIATMGDMNGNGYDDLVVGAPGDSDGGDNCGAVWVLYMSRTSVTKEPAVQTHLKLRPRTGTFLSAPADAGEFGTAVAAIDVNGDDTIDLAIGAPKLSDRSDSQVTDVGAVYVLSITATGEAGAYIVLDKANSAMAGAALVEGDQFGSSLCSADVDGD